jgi:hypothetical protein
MAAVTKNRRDGYLVVKDGAGGSEEVCFMNSDFTYNDPVAADPIPITNRKGALHHVKENDPFSGWGATSFSFKYVNKDLKEALCNPAVTTAVPDDLIPARYKCVNLEFVLTDQNGEIEEIHHLYNVYFDRGKCVYNDGDEYSTMSATGTIFGKYDETAEDNRRYSYAEEAY